MARSIYLTSVRSGGGKSTIALGLAELLSRQVERISAFRPLIGAPGEDSILTLLTDRYRIDIGPDECFGATYDEARALVADAEGCLAVADLRERDRRTEDLDP